MAEDIVSELLQDIHPLLELLPLLMSVILCQCLAIGLSQGDRVPSVLGVVLKQELLGHFLILWRHVPLGVSLLGWLLRPRHLGNLKLSEPAQVVFLQRDIGCLLVFIWRLESWLAETRRFLP
uniref:Uncharacterized protein n=1 Tax=Strombidium inclinatum TaxID=197538 RepID=A0A7S3MSY8_9SPIT